MKLYYTPGACSLSPHIVARELGLPLQLEKVDLAKKTTESGKNFLDINPKGYVPALEIEPGQVLTEGTAILQYLGSLAPDSPVVPKFASLEYFRAVEWLAFIGTEIHKGFGPLFAGPNPDAKEKLEKRLSFVAQQLKGRQFLLGDPFTLPDAYLFTTLRWADYVQIDLKPFDGLIAYRDRVGARQKVSEALEAEGLLNPVA
jgi:glutathione S-transferase